MGGVRAGDVPPLWSSIGPGGVGRAVARAFRPLAPGTVERRPRACPEGRLGHRVVRGQGARSGREGGPRRLPRGGVRTLPPGGDRRPRTARPWPPPARE